MGSSRRRLVRAAVTLLSSAPALVAGELHVPAQHPTIQQAIAAAAPGDVVLVAPGIYHEAIDFVGKGIQVVGVAGAEYTTIDATGLGTSVVTLRQGEPSTTLLRGFTLTGGTGQVGGGSNGAGGGICVISPACPTIRDCRINGNTGQHGGGLYISHFSDGPPAQVLDCEVSNNQATSYGGGIYVSVQYSTTRPLIRHCTILGNQAGHAGGCYGGGDFLDCRISGNHASGDGGGAHSVRTLTGSVLEGNTAGQAGGGYFDYQLYGVTLADCALVENHAAVGGGAALRSTSHTLFGGGPYAFVSGCVFARNESGSSTYGDGLSLFLQTFTIAQTWITNCTFDADSFLPSGPVEIRNCIFRNGGSPAGFVTYSNIEGGWPGIGNFDADPLWVDPAGGDYHLSSCSPCIDAGDPTSPLDPDGTAVDVGAIPFEPWIELGGGVPGATGQAELAVTGALLPGQPMTLTLSQAAPNTPLWMILSPTALNAPFKGGTFWPALDVIVTELSTDSAGALQLSGTWPPAIPCGFLIYVQVWWPDMGAEGGWAASDGLRGA